MNRVFLTGTLKTKPEISYTPKGEKIITFPLAVGEGELDIDVLFVGEPEREGLSRQVGKEITVAGMLSRMKTRTKAAIRVKANKIFWMEE